MIFYTIAETTNTLFLLLIS